MSLLGKDLSENIITLCTFADNQNPKVLSALRAGNIPHDTFFKFNNAFLFEEN